MKVVILAGGLGTRISEETELRPKPMIEIGGMPIIWHIMKIYSNFGINEFIICCGYKGYLIKEYFANYSIHTSDITFDLSNNQVKIHKNSGEDWKITLIDTGENTLTGGRIKRIRNHINERFLMTYGDGLADIDIPKLINFHDSHNKLATLTAVQPPGRWGSLNISGNTVKNFQEKPEGDGSWINGGFFLLEPEVIDFIDGDDCSWEQEPLMKLAKNNQLMSFKHNGFWKAMDTLRDKRNLENLWNSGNPPWKTWK